MHFKELILVFVTFIELIILIIQVKNEDDNLNNWFNVTILHKSVTALCF